MSVHARQIAPFGGPVGLTWVAGAVLAAWQSGAGAGVDLRVVELDGTTLEPTRARVVPLGDDVGAWPVCYATGDRAWVAYREGASKGGRAVVIDRQGGEAWRSSIEAGGNHPVALGSVGGQTVFAWQRAGDNAITVHRIDNPAWALAGGHGAADGLASPIAGGVVLWKDNFGSAWPGMTAPSRAGVLVAGEHPESGVLVRAADGRVLRLFEGQESATPVLAFDAATGRYAVATWGSRGGVDFGVRVATFLEADLAAPAPLVAPWPAWREVERDGERVVEWTSGGGWTLREDVGIVDVWRAWVGAVPWARNGMPTGTGPADYAHVMQARQVGPGAVQITKALGAGPRDATFTTDGAYLALPWDRTNELEGGYGLFWPGTRQAARLYPVLASVTPNRATRATREAYRRDVPVERVDLGTGARLPVVWRGWVEAAYDGPALGDVVAGRYVLIGWQFDFLGDGADGDPNGFRELSLCHVDAGPVAWEETRVSTGASRRWYGVRNVARVADPAPRGVEALPTAAPIVGVPVPSPNPSLKPRDQFFAEFTRVNEFYAADEGLQRPGGMVIDGGADVVAMRQWGYDLMTGQSADQVIGQIRRSEEWRAKHPDGEPASPGPTPTSTRRGQLIVDGGIFKDANGPRHPFYVHFGDVFSRASRDLGGVVSLLDEIVAFGADGIRGWSWLLGSPYWDGRTFRGDFRVLERVLAELQERNLRLVLSQGDLWQAGESTARAWLAECAGWIRAIGPEWVDFVDAANEGWHNRCEDPDAAARAMRPLANVGPILPLTDFLADQEWPGNTADERKAAMLAACRRWLQGPAMVLDGHPAYSDGDGCVRRTWNFAYELREAHAARAWINSEPRGFGRNVTVYSGTTRSDQLLTAAATWITSGAYVAMSSPGVISDGMKNGHFDGGERFADLPGFSELNALRAWLPAGCGGWRWVHGGNRAGSPRVFAVDEGAEGARADHAINEATGEYVAILYGGPRRQVRDATVEDFAPLDGGRRIVKGQIA